MERSIHILLASLGVAHFGVAVALLPVIVLVMGFLAGGLSIVSLCVSCLSALKVTTLSGDLAPASGGHNDPVRPELFRSAKGDG